MKQAIAADQAARDAGRHRRLGGRNEDPHAAVTTAPQCTAARVNHETHQETGRERADGHTQNTLSQLSLTSLRGRLIEYQLRLG